MMAALWVVWHNMEAAPVLATQRARQRAPQGWLRGALEVVASECAVGLVEEQHGDGGLVEAAVELRADEDPVLLLSRGHGRAGADGGVDGRTD